MGSVCTFGLNGVFSGLGMIFIGRWADLWGSLGSERSRCCFQCRCTGAICRAVQLGCDWRHRVIDSFSLTLVE